MANDCAAGVAQASTELAALSDHLAELSADPLMGARLHQRIIDLRIDLDANLRARCSPISISSVTA
jgi:hypothetical protein